MPKCRASLSKLPYGRCIWEWHDRRPLSCYDRFDDLADSRLESVRWKAESYGLEDMSSRGCSRFSSAMMWLTPPTTAGVGKKLGHFGRISGATVGVDSWSRARARVLTILDGDQEAL
jgi:hypothetical protein